MFKKYNHLQNTLPETTKWKYFRTSFMKKANLNPREMNQMENYEPVALEQRLRNPKQILAKQIHSHTRKVK